MKTTVVYPKNKELKKYIKYFLFMKNEDTKYSKKHISYPNTNHCLGLLQGCKLIEKSEYEYAIIKSESDHSYLTGIYDKPIIFYYSGIFDEICIDFEPLGLERLTGYKLSNLKFVNHSIENLFSKKWMEIYTKAFTSGNPNIRAKLLEDFFLKNLTANTKNDFIPFNCFNVLQVDDLKNHFNLSYRSIHRLYTDSLDLSPKEFLKILRFRKGITNLKSSNSNHSQIAFQVGCADQSHFIKDFKNYTNLTPKQFLNTADLINDEVWLTTE